MAIFFWLISIGIERRMEFLSGPGVFSDFFGIDILSKNIDLGDHFVVPDGI